MRITIVGAGLAGCWLAWRLLDRGIDVTVVDPLPSVSSSTVAAGLINPITGPRFQTTWKGALVVPLAEQAYGAVARSTGATVMRSLRLRRLLRDADSVRRVQQRQEQGEYDWLDVHTLPAGSMDGVDAAHGAIDVPALAINTEAFLHAVRSRIRAEGTMLESHADATIVPGPPADIVVWCMGWHAATDPRWSWIPFAPVRGDILDVYIPGYDIPYILTGGVWLIPMGNCQYRLGSTYDWEALHTTPLPEKAEELLVKAQALIRRPLTVLNHKAAVRPAILTRRPVIGAHPDNPRHWIFNGLGTKGAVLAPWMSAHLTECILDGAEPDPETTISQYLPR
ncbi:MAG: FAD-binding oxidoreductase [Candidatus Kapabacteria bacterium]|jgi:glycine/D-amino acid oxidase-like deaminating enzyme|nr:FAD-binding oxidoreductase [Candidatus Kapabacteria bacterium]